jgi:hypothetical protein
MRSQAFAHLTKKRKQQASIDLSLALKLKTGLNQSPIQTCSTQTVYFTKFLNADPKIK